MKLPPPHNMHKHRAADIAQGRRWPSYALGVIPFGVALFVWFGALAELLPSNF